MASPSTQAGDWYDPATHRYYLGGREVPGVTAVLKHAGLIDGRFLRNEQALRLGTLAHKATELMDAMSRNGDVIEITEFSVDGIARSTKAAVGHVKAYASFLYDHAPRYTAIECGLLHPTLRYGGRTDRICADLGGQGPAVLEIKTGGEAPWHGVQLAGYQMLFPTGSRWVVYLGADGRYRLRRVTEASHYRTFLDALASYHAAQGGATA